jgi:hypothetical protein
MVIIYIELEKENGEVLQAEAGFHFENGDFSHEFGTERVGVEAMLESVKVLENGDWKSLRDEELPAYGSSREKLEELALRQG